MQLTQEDIRLRQCLAAKIDLFRQNIQNGRPYVWELRLSLDDFNTLELAINSSISSHSNSHEHLLTEEFALISVVYLAEWYKRYYKGADTIDEDKRLTLNSKELERLFDTAHIDKNTFVYNASKNPNRTNYRWQESLQILGGLAIQAELKRDRQDNLLAQLCRIFHGEDETLDDLKDRERAVAFHESIVKQHSLYEFLKCILEKNYNGKRYLPFAASDIKDERTMIPQLISRIEDADKEAKKQKFDFEWIITYTASRQLMTRCLKVKLKPEVIGGGLKQYLGYDRLRLPEWGVAHPEDIGRIEFFLRFKNGSHIVKKENSEESPIFKYDNTGSEETGFVAINTPDENYCNDIPVDRFDSVEVVMKYNGGSKVVQVLKVGDYMQVYALHKSTTRFSDRRNSQATTAVIFSSSYRLADEYKNLPVAFAHYRNAEKISEDYCWCTINDKIVLVDADGVELKPLFNRNGLYQVVTKKYLKTIKYKENVYVLYKYIDPEFDDDDIQDDDMPVLFGRSGLEVFHYPNSQAKEGIPVKDYDLYWKKNRNYIDWSKEEPQQGLVRLRVCVKDYIFDLDEMYYVPFTPESSSQQPIWRDFERMRICTALDGVEDIQDDFKLLLTDKEKDTIPLEIGTEKGKILIDVYRPVKVRELSQKPVGEDQSRIVSYHRDNEEIHIPLIDCEQFSVRDFSEDGVREYQVKSRETAYYSFPTINHIGLGIRNYLEEHSAKDLSVGVPLDCLKIYITRADDHPQNLYAWKYGEEPKFVDSLNNAKDADIIFQSLKDNESPRHYACPKINNDDDGWDDDDDWDNDGEKVVISALKCFKTVAEHKIYFFLFEPLIKAIAGRTQIKDIVLPLIKERNYQLTDEDIAHLYRFAMQFHFDWMLLPRELWKCQLSDFAANESEHQRLAEAVIDFFRKTPKCTDGREKECLNEFLEKYWLFRAYPKVDDIAIIALRLIKDEPDALGKIRELKDYLKIYDECRFKFSEMSKAV